MNSNDLTTIINKDALLNEDNNLFIKKKYELSNNSSYQLIQYNKSNLDESKYDDYGLFRSVVFNLNNKNMVCYSPPKSLTFDLFQKQLTNNILVEEFVEGTMINLFYDDNKWQIATKGSIGGNCKFYQGEDTQTFYDMFNQICNEVKFDYNILPTSYSYSFIMQHTKNRMVKPLKNNNLYFITAYKMNNENDNMIITDLINSDEMKSIKSSMNEYTQIKFPEKYGEFHMNEIQNMDEYYKIYASKNTKYDIMGVVFKNNITGSHMKIRNPNHIEIHALKGNHCKIQYIYLNLRKNGNINKYLRFYPEDRKTFSFLRNQMHSYSKQLYENYIGCYIQKMKPLKEWPYEYRTHMFNIHQIYLTELIENKQKITMHVIIQYVNDLHPSQQMYALNYNLRKKNMDTFDIEIKNDKENKTDNKEEALDC